MKRYIWAVLIASVLVVASTTFPSSAVARTSNIERAVVSVDEPVKLLGVVLQGRYLFLHHDGMSEHGRPCMFVYSLNPSNEGTRIVAFHCSQAVRARSLDFKLVTRDIPGGLPEVTEVQFAGTSEGHQLPDYESAE